MGEWVHRKVDEHVHDYPRALAKAPDAKIGDVWRCDCGVKFRVVGFDYGMQWDPYPTVINWVQADGYGVVPR